MYTYTAVEGNIRTIVPVQVLLHDNSWMVKKLTNIISTELSIENLKQAYFGFHTYFSGIFHEFNALGHLLIQIIFSELYIIYQSRTFQTLTTTNTSTCKSQFKLSTNYIILNQFQIDNICHIFTLNDSQKKIALFYLTERKKLILISLIE